MDAKSRYLSVHVEKNTVRERTRIMGCNFMFRTLQESEGRTTIRVAGTKPQDINMHPRSG
jgi:hypothetical protein